MVSSAPSIPGSRNMRIRRCAKAPLKNVGGGEEGGDVCDLAVLEGKLDAHSALFRAAGVKAAVGHLVSRIEQRRFRVKLIVADADAENGVRLLGRGKADHAVTAKPGIGVLAEVIARVGTGLHYALAALVGEPLEAVGVILLCVVCAAASSNVPNHVNAALSKTAAASRIIIASFSVFLDILL